MEASIVDTDVLVVGAGPSGGALASFLGQNGLKGIMISSASGTADTPRAHLVNPFALETLREIRLEDDALRLGMRGRSFQAFRWCHSMAGEEYGKVLTWGSHPNTVRETSVASPCEWIDLPQSHMEPLLVKYAAHHGFQVRFSTELVETKRSDGRIVCTLRDLVTDSIFRIRTKYIFGADGGRSIVARSLDFKFASGPSNGVATNILLNADLDHLITPVRHAQLHSIMRPDSKSKFARFGTAPIMRAIRPWNQWLLVCITPGVSEDPFRDFTPESPELHEFVRDVIGDDTVDIEVVRLDPWVIREIVAERFSSSENDAFLLGDAAHRHPPALALGSNTCLQDAFNLGWKVAYVTKGLAGPGLLESYTQERQPVGAQLVREANNHVVKHTAVWEALGMLAKTEEEGQQLIAELSAPTEAGSARRARLHDALEGKRQEGEGIGIAGNQWYASGAIYLDDEPGERPPLGGPFFTTFQVSTYPGTRLPHAWLDVPAGRKEISTKDLAGRGAFCLLTGISGEAWKRAAESISRATGIPINSYGIGFGQDYHDVYRDWYRSREVHEDGCVLVRPDKYVAWRAMNMVPDCEGKLLSVLNRILSRDQLKLTNGQ